MLDEPQVRNLINSITDPCSAARGVPIGLSDMGLVPKISVEPGTGGEFGVAATLRVTGPGCNFFIDFEAQVRRALLAGGAAWVRIDWDTSFDWTPDDMAKSAQERLERNRATRKGSLALQTRPVG